MHLIGLGGTATLIAAITEPTNKLVTFNIYLGTISLFVSICVGLRKAYKEDRVIFRKHYKYVLTKIRLCKNYIINIKKKQ